MSNAKQVEQTLNDLLLEVRALNVGDPDTKQRMERLVLDIERMLEHPKDTPTGASVGDRWRRSIVGFEASHPRLAALMNDALEELSKMGI